MKESLSENQRLLVGEIEVLSHCYGLVPRKAAGRSNGKIKSALLNLGFGLKGIEIYIDNLYLIVCII